MPIIFLVLLLVLGIREGALHPFAPCDDWAQRASYISNVGKLSRRCIIATSRGPRLSPLIPPLRGGGRGDYESIDQEEVLQHALERDDHVANWKDDLGETARDPPRLFGFLAARKENNRRSHVFSTPRTTHFLPPLLNPENLLLIRNVATTAF